MVFIKGYNDNTIRPKQEISQQEYETIMKRVASITTDKTSGNYTEEMKIEKNVDLSPEDGLRTLWKEWVTTKIPLTTAILTFTILNLQTALLFFTILKLISRLLK